MLVAKFIVASLVAFTSATALPGEFDTLTLIDPTCPPGQEYSGWYKSCKCDNGQSYDQALRTCKKPTYPSNRCGTGEKYYCAKSQNEYCEYGRFCTTPYHHVAVLRVTCPDYKNPLCWDDDDTQSFCCKPEDLKQKLKTVCPTHPPCSPPRMWYRNQCQCPKGKVS